MMIKKLIILTVLISLLFLVACKSEMVEDYSSEMESAEEESSSSEEVELDEGLEGLDELDSLDEEFGSGVSFDDLEDLDLE